MTNKMVLQTLFFIWIYLMIDETLALPTGAPCSQIDTMTPQHRGGLTSRPPFRISLSASCYIPGVAFQVKLRGLGDRQFKGFILQARKGCNSTSTKRMGLFIDNAEKVHWKYQCKTEETSVTHAWNDPKDSVQVDWATDSYKGEIVFVATVVQDYSKFYVQALRSRPISHCAKHVPRCKPGEGAPAPVTKPTEASTTPVPAASGRCGQPHTNGTYCSGAGGYEERFYFHQTENTCKQFWYGGCNGNENNFHTKERCKRECIVKPAKERKALERQKIVAESDICNLPKALGKWCQPPGPLEFWTFDKKEGKCKEFWYLGCRGNFNRFESKEDCEDACITRGCKRFRDKDVACPSWVKADSSLCGVRRGSGLVRNVCEQSCCELYRRYTTLS